MDWCYQLILLVLCHLSQMDVSWGGTRMLEPPSRASLWRYGYNTPVNTWDDKTDCGGYEIHHLQNKGRCGVCGDPADQATPRRHEAGGEYVPNPRPVRAYEKGRFITVVMETTSSLFGKFQFRLCQISHNMRTPDQGCFDQHLLPILEAELGTEFQIGSRQGVQVLNVQLPVEMTCDHCILQWRHQTGYMTNKEGCLTCANSSGPQCHVCKGCGDQVWHVGCTDIMIYEGFQFTSPNQIPQNAALLTSTSPDGSNKATTTNSPAPTGTAPASFVSTASIAGFTASSSRQLWPLLPTTPASCTCPSPDPNDNLINIPTAYPILFLSNFTNNVTTNSSVNDFVKANPQNNSSVSNNITNNNVSSNSSSINGSTSFSGNNNGGDSNSNNNNSSDYKNKIYENNVENTTNNSNLTNDTNSSLLFENCRNSNCTNNNTLKVISATTTTPPIVNLNDTSLNLSTLPPSFTLSWPPLEVNTPAGTNGMITVSTESSLSTTPATKPIPNATSVISMTPKSSNISITITTPITTEILSAINKTESTSMNPIAETHTPHSNCTRSNHVRFRTSAKYRRNRNKTSPRRVLFSGGKSKIDQVIPLLSSSKATNSSSKLSPPNNKNNFISEFQKLKEQIQKENFTKEMFPLQLTTRNPRSDQLVTNYVGDVSTMAVDPELGNPISDSPKNYFCFATNTVKYPTENFDHWCQEKCPSAGLLVCFFQTCSYIPCANKTYNNSNSRSWVNGITNLENQILSSRANVKQNQSATYNMYTNAPSEIFPNSKSPETANFYHPRTENQYRLDQGNPQGLDGQFLLRWLLRDIHAGSKHDPVRALDLKPQPGLDILNGRVSSSSQPREQTYQPQEQFYQPNEQIYQPFYQQQNGATRWPLNPAYSSWRQGNNERFTQPSGQAGSASINWMSLLPLLMAGEGLEL